MRELLPEDQSKTITVNNVEGLLPDQTHVFGGGQLHLSYMTDKWIMKRLKQRPNFNLKYPNIRIKNKGST